MTTTRALTIHALKLEVKDQRGDVLPSLAPFWEFLATHPHLLKPTHQTLPEKATFGEVTATGDGAWGSLSGSAHRNLGEAAELNTYQREPLPLRDEQGIARTLYWRAWNMEGYRSGGRLSRAAILLFPSLRGAGSYRNLERLLRDAVAAQGWQVELAVVRSPEPFDQLRLNEGAKSFKLAAILHTDEQRHIRVSATDFELGIDHVKVEIKLTPAERGARFSRTSVLGVQHAVRERRDEWTKFEVVDAEGLSLDLLDGILRYRATIEVRDPTSGVLDQGATIHALHEIYRTHQDTLLKCFGVER